MRLLRQPLTIVFLVMISLPMAVHGVAVLTGDAATVIGAENREAITSSLTNPQGIDQYLSDNFGLRMTYLSLYQRVRDAVGLETVDGQVVVGSEGWLFLNHADMVDEYRGVVPVTNAVIERWATQLSQLATSGSSAILIPPNKMTVYGQYLPLGINKGTASSRRTRLQVALAQQGLVVVDPLPVLVTAAEDRRVFHQTDTHWNDDGAYLAYAEIIKWTEEAGFAASLFPYGQLQREEIDSWTGDLVVLLGTSRFDETIKRLSPPSWGGVLPTRVPPTTEPLVFEQDLPGAPTLFLSTDSFGLMLLPYLRQSFSRITVTFRKPEEIEAATFARLSADADLTLFILVERYLVNELVFLDQ